MGTWSVAINGNDEFRTVYDYFKELYTEYDGKKWVYDIPGIKRRMEESFTFLLSKEELAKEYWLAIAKASWDFGIEDDWAIKKVKEIVAAGTDSKAWKELGGKEKDIKKREKLLSEFISKLSATNSHPIKRGKVIKVQPIFSRGDLLTFRDTEGMYYGAVVTGAYRDTKGTNIIHLLDYRSVQKPAKEELVKAALLVLDKEVKEAEPDGWGNRNANNIYGLMLSAKKYKEQVLKAEKVGDIVFHEFAFWKDGLKSFCDLLKYDWNVLPAYAILNAGTDNKPPYFKAKLVYYTTEMDITEAELAAIITSFKQHKPVKILGHLFDPGIMKAWLSQMNGSEGKVSVYISMEGFDQSDTFLINNILSRVFGEWLKHIGLVIDEYFFRVEDVIEKSGTTAVYYKSLDVVIEDWGKRKLINK